MITDFSAELRTARCLGSYHLRPLKTFWSSFLGDIAQNQKIQRSR
jgi:hypothetical protein